MGIRSVTRFLAALGVCAVAAPAAATPVDLLVHVNITFDSSITSTRLQALTQQEAAELWSPYGVGIEWTDTGAPADLYLNAIVERTHEHINPDRPIVLGHALVAPGATVLTPIRISLNAVDALLDHVPCDLRLFPERVTAIAVGRILAHELGHVLLGSPGYHDPQGLMRAKFTSDDLARMEHSRFGLADNSIARLRTRIASLLEASETSSCPRF